MLRCFRWLSRICAYFMRYFFFFCRAAPRARALMRGFVTRHICALSPTYDMPLLDAERHYSPRARCRAQRGAAPCLMLIRAATCAMLMMRCCRGADAAWCAMRLMRSADAITQFIFAPWCCHAWFPRRWLIDEMLSFTAFMLAFAFSLHESFIIISAGCQPLRWCFRHYAAFAIISVLSIFTDIFAFFDAFDAVSSSMPPLRCYIFRWCLFSRRRYDWCFRYDDFDYCFLWSSRRYNTCFLHADWYFTPCFHYAIICLPLSPLFS